MYLLLICTALFNVYTTPYVFEVQDDEIGELCHPSLYNFTQVIVIIFNVILTIVVVLWMSSMLTGLILNLRLCLMSIALLQSLSLGFLYPDMFIDYFYEEGILPPHVHFIWPSWLTGNKEEKDVVDKVSFERVERREIDAFPTPVTPSPSTVVDYKANHHWMEEERKAWISQQFRPFGSRNQSFVTTSSIFQLSKMASNRPSSRSNSITSYGNAYTFHRY